MNVTTQFLLVAHTVCFCHMAEGACAQKLEDAQHVKRLADALWANKHLSEALRICERVQRTCHERQEALLAEVHPPERHVFKQIWP